MWNSYGKKMHFPMMLRSSKSDVPFKVKLKIKLRSINDIEFDLESNV